jgi:hypothetical protein
VFCGLPPTEKTKEHVIPQWLLALTGDPNRTVTFGYNFRAKGKAPAINEFAFDQFQFPACARCNGTAGAELEDRAQGVLGQLLSRNRLDRSGAVIEIANGVDRPFR